MDLQDHLWKTMAVPYDIIPSEKLGMSPKLPRNNRVNPRYLLCSFNTEPVCPEGFRTNPSIRNAVKERTWDFINGYKYFINEINNSILSIMRARHWGVIWKFFRLSNHDLSTANDYIYSVNQAFHTGRGCRILAKALLRKLKEAIFLPNLFPFLIVCKCFCHRLPFHKGTINTASLSWFFFPVLYSPQKVNKAAVFLLLQKQRLRSPQIC